VAPSRIEDARSVRMRDKSPAAKEVQARRFDKAIECNYKLLLAMILCLTIMDLLGYTSTYPQIHHMSIY
jgi:hypothetical protein